MKTRVISAAVMITAVVACFAISPITRTLFLLAVIIVAVRETCNVIKLKDVNCAPWVLYIFSAASVAAIFFGADSVVTEALFFLAVFAAMTAGVTCSRVRGPGALATLAVLVYPIVPMLIITKLSLMENWLPIFAIGCISTWVCDSFCLFGGKAFGKHKLSPAVSPNKTIEGSVCGALSSVVTGLILSFFIDVPLLWCMVTALVCSSLGQVGDLAASLLKRMAGVKDYSNLIPGHGGAMDRIDSLLFSVPSAYFCLLLFKAI
ncbi:MAG: phosphatidate cytidylyltransferase [Oscillospiraceae bacterium]|nr:phosphatidate cytidylyltransferase [Oscillospiraceae bacterium]